MVEKGVKNNDNYNSNDKLFTAADPCDVIDKHEKLTRIFSLFVLLFQIMS